MPSAAPVRLDIQLARSLPALLAAPGAALVAGVIVIAAGLLLADGPLQIALIAAGAVVGACGLVLAALLLSIRVESTGDGLRVASLLGTRHHVLAPGPVTRLTLRGPDAVPLRGGLGGGAWAFGRARLRRSEPVWVVRLAPVDTIVLVPTDLGRLAVAPRSEEALLEALAVIGRRHDEEEAAGEARLDEGGVEEASLEPPAPEPIVPRLLTGIERSIVTELLDAIRAEEEAAALLRAEEEAASRESQANAGIAAPPPPTVAAAPRDRRHWFGRWGRGRAIQPPLDAPPSPTPVAPIASVAAGEVELHAPPVAEPALEPQIRILPEVRIAREDEPRQVPTHEAPSEPVPVAFEAVEMPAAEVVSVEAEPAAVPVAAPAAPPARRRRRRSRLRRRIDRLVALPPAARVLGIALIAVPLGVAAAAWFAADELGTLPEAAAGRRSVALALLLVGPVTALAAIVARAASPRLVGLVLLSAGAAIVLIGRALLPL